MACYIVRIPIQSKSKISQAVYDWMLKAHEDEKLRQTILREFLNLFETISEEIIDFKVEVNKGAIQFLVNTKVVATLRNNVVTTPDGFYMANRFTKESYAKQSEINAKQARVDQLAKLVEQFASGLHNNAIRRFMLNRVENTIEEKFGGMKVNRDIKNVEEDAMAISMQIQQQNVQRVMEMQ